MGTAEQPHAGGAARSTSCSNRPEVASGLEPQLEQEVGVGGHFTWPPTPPPGCRSRCRTSEPGPDKLFRKADRAAQVIAGTRETKHSTRPAGPGSSDCLRAARRWSDCTDQRVAGPSGSEVGGRRSEVGGGRSEVGGRRSEENLGSRTSCICTESTMAWARSCSLTLRCWRCVSTCRRPRRRCSGRGPSA